MCASDVCVRVCIELHSIDDRLTPDLVFLIHVTSSKQINCIGPQISHKESKENVITYS